MKRKILIPVFILWASQAFSQDSVRHLDSHLYEIWSSGLGAETIDEHFTIKEFEAILKKVNFDNQIEIMRKFSYLYIQSKSNAEQSHYSILPPSIDVVILHYDFDKIDEIRFTSDTTGYEKVVESISKDKAFRLVVQELEVEDGKKVPIFSVWVKDGIVYSADKSEGYIGISQNSKDYIKKPTLQPYKNSK